MSNINVGVGKRIRVFRKARGYTQDELGEILQIDQSYLGRIERGEINVTLETLSKISDALNIKPSQLLEVGSLSSDKHRSETLEKIDALLFSLDNSDLQIIYKLLKEAVALRKK